MSDEVIETPLDNIFNGETVETTETEVVEVETEKPTVETETEAKAEETTDAPTASKDEQPSVEKQLAAQITKAQDEKGKRQTLKQENEVLRQQLAQHNRVEPPDAYAEPDKALAYAKAELRQEFQGQFLNMSEQNAKARYSGDFDVMTDTFFNEMLKENPSLQAEAMRKVDPYEFIYRTAKNHVELKQLNEAGGVEGYREAIEKEFRAKWDAEQAEKTKEAVEKAIDESIPGSLATQRAAGGNKANTFAGPTPLKNILSR